MEPAVFTIGTHSRCSPEGGRTLLRLVQEHTVALHLLLITPPVGEKTLPAQLATAEGIERLNRIQAMLSGF